MVTRASTRILLAFALALGAIPAMAGTTDTAALEAKVDRLLTQLVNDERFGHLEVAANYEALRGALMNQACIVAAAPCAALDRQAHEAGFITTEISPEQVEAIQQLMYSLQDARASVTQPAAQLLVTATE